MLESRLHQFWEDSGQTIKLQNLFCTDAGSVASVKRLSEASCLVLAFFLCFLGTGLHKNEKTTQSGSKVTQDHELRSFDENFQKGEMFWGSYCSLLTHHSLGNSQTKKNINLRVWNELMLRLIDCADIS